MPSRASARSWRRFIPRKCAASSAETNGSAGIKTSKGHRPRDLWPERKTEVSSFEITRHGRLRCKDTLYVGECRLPEVGGRVFRKPRKVNLCKLFIGGLIARPFGDNASFIITAFHIFPLFIDSPYAAIRMRRYSQRNRGKSASGAFEVGRVVDIEVT